MKLKCQYFGHLMWRADSLVKTMMLGKLEGKRRRGWQMIRWLDGIIDSMDMSLSKLLEIVKHREAWYAVVHGFTKGWTWLSDWTTKFWSNSAVMCPMYLDKSFHLLDLQSNFRIELCCLDMCESSYTVLWFQVNTGSWQSGSFLKCWNSVSCLGLG